MKPELLLLHGALGSKEEFIQLEQDLSSNFNVHTLNFEGHGHSTSENEFSINLFTKNVTDYLQSNKLTSIDIFGFSMGGYVALNLAVQQPQLVNSIMTLGTKFDWTVESSTKEVNMLNPDVIEQKVPKFAQYLQSLHGLENWKIVMQKTTELMFNLGRGLGINHDHLKAIHQKVLLCLGDQDTMVSTKETKIIGNLLPNSSLRLIQDFKHPIATIDKSILAEHIIEYFEQ